MPTEYRPPRQLLVDPGRIDHHVADMTATISCDLPQQTVQDRLAEFDQWIPIDGDAALPIGRLVEENSTGPLRLGYGAWRDLLLGCQLQAPGGPLITAGGRTMKNVAGYDLTKLMVGQRGVLANLCTITVRTYRRPEAALFAEFAPSDRWLGGIITTPLRPHYAVLTSDALICGWLGDERHIQHFETLVARHHPRKVLRRSLEQDIEHRAELWRAEGSFFRASVPPAKILSFASLLPSCPGTPGEDRDGGLRRKCWIADAAFGIVIGPYTNDDAAMIAQAAETTGGSVTFFPAGKAPIWRPSPVETALLEAIRKSFVPVD